jgi:leader peptidase (prepilin peptidase) / N-methyltransferase
MEAPLTLDFFPPAFLRVFAVLMGLLWGSFLNVVIYRVPRDMSVVRPASHCPACGAAVRPWLNVPVVSYVILRGKASCCGAKLSPRYPLVEAIGGVISLAILEVLILTMDPSTPVWRVGAVYVAHLALGLGMVAAAFIDLEHMILPDSITIGGAILGVGTATLRSRDGLDITMTDSLVGAAVGFLVVWLLFDVLYRKLRGGSGMGLGDAKLLALAGAWFGWEGALVVLGAGAMQGTLVTIGVLSLGGKLDEPEAVKREREELLAELETLSPDERAELEEELAGDPLFQEPEEGLMRARIPFGPFLALAVLEYMFVGPFVVEGFLSWTL